MLTSLFSAHPAAKHLYPSFESVKFSSSLPKAGAVREPFDATPMNNISLSEVKSKYSVLNLILTVFCVY